MASSGVTWIKGSPSAFLNYGVSIEEFIKAEVSVIMDSVMKEAAAKMREFIASRGLPNSKGSGRIDTGDMINSVDARVEVDGLVVNGTFGWLDTGEVYFLAQEEGAVLWNGGVIAPMLALYDAGQWAIEEFKSRLGAILK